MLTRAMGTTRVAVARAATRCISAPAAAPLYPTGCCIAAAARSSHTSLNRCQQPRSTLRAFSSSAASLSATPLTAAATAASLSSSPLHSMRYALEGQCALVTGGSSGIGLAIAQLLAEQGVQVAITSRSAKRAIKAAADMDATILHMQRHTAATIAAAEVAAPLAAAAASPASTHAPPPLSAVLPVLGLECDVRSSVSVDTAVEAAWAAFGGRLDIVVHAAGVSHDALIARASDAAIEDTLQTNLVGALYLSRAVARKMISKRPLNAAVQSTAESDAAAAATSGDAAAASAAPLLTAYPGGTLVFIGSIVGQHGAAGQSVYAASKSGLHGLTLSLSQELAARSVRVHCVCPGFIDTPMTRSLSVRALASIQARLPAGVAIGEATDVAHLVAFLASPAAKYITGQIMAVDGGIKK